MEDLGLGEGGGNVDGQEVKIDKLEHMMNQGNLKEGIERKESNSFKSIPVVSKLSSRHVARRTSTGGIPDKLSTPSAVKRPSVGSSGLPIRSRPLEKDLGRHSLPETRRSTVPSVASKSTLNVNSSVARKPSLISSTARNVGAVSRSSISKQGVPAKSQPALSGSASNRATSSSSSLESSGGSKVRTSSSVSSGLKVRPTSSLPGKSSTLANQKRVDSKDSRFIVLPQVETKVGDDVVCLLLKLVFDLLNLNDTMLFFRMKM